jgi:hypothetical protein
MEKYYVDTREIALNLENTALNMEKKVVLAFNLLNPEDSNLKQEEKTEITNKKVTPLREGLEKLKKEVENMGTAEFSFWIVNTLLLFLIVLKEFLLI